MARYHLQTPFSEEAIRQLRAGDIVHFDGTLFGIRDLTQIYMFDQHHEPPVSLKGMPCIHTAPSLKKVDGKWVPICVGTTTSYRMERFTPPLIENYGVRAIIGKGGLYEQSLEAMKNAAPSIWRLWAARRPWRPSRLSRWSRFTGSISIRRRSISFG